MEPNKLEKEFRKKLSERKIDPSANAWDRLDAMLTVAEEKKPKRNYGWMYMAASFLGFLLIGTIFFSQTEELIDLRKNEVVYEKINPVPSSEEDVVIEKDYLIPSVNKSEIVAVVSEVKNQKKSNSKSTVAPKENSEAGNNQSQVAENSPNNNVEVVPNIVKQDMISNDRQLVAAAVSSADGNVNPSIKVDARNLLSQVDGELELSFREKIIHTVNKNYKTVKVALANRNQE